jgi:hypothetical protein
MDSEITQPEIQIAEHSSPFWFRVCFSAAAVFCVVWLGTDFFMKTGARSMGDLAVLLFSLALVCWIILQNLRSDVRWTIRSDDIRIDRHWIVFERQEAEFIKRGDITKISIATGSDEGGVPVIFYIRLWLASGEEIESPPLRNAQRSRELKAEIVKRLNVTHEDV